MRESTTVNKAAHRLSWLAAVILVILPFYAFLAVWGSSFAGHYTALRLGKEALLAVLMAGAVYLLIADAKLRKKIFSSVITKSIFLYLLVTVAWAGGAYALGEVTAKAMGYGIIVNLRFLFFFLAIWIIATKSPLLRELWPKILLIPAAAVAVVALLQRFALPYDVLRHFGYNEQTIFPYQTINYDINYPRVMSTLRGANPLGAYMLLILSAAAVLFIKLKTRRRIWGALGAAALVSLFLSYSRAAWIGAALSAILLAWILLRGQAGKTILTGLVILLAFSAGFALAVRGNTTLENYFFHTNSKSTVEESSNEERLSALKNGVNDMLSEPIGRGVGTAGPASVYNDSEVRIAENYYVQVAQEAGWLGLALFAAVNILVARALWFRRSDSLALILLVSLAGLAAVNMVSHAWTDDTIAYIWWGLAGLALAKPAGNGK